MVFISASQQAFMQIGWMEDDFRNLTAIQFGQILDNPIKRYDFGQ